MSNGRARLARRYEAVLVPFLLRGVLSCSEADGEPSSERQQAFAAALLASGQSELLALSAIPTSWTCLGACGTDGPDGIVSLSPAGNPAYQWVSTSTGSQKVGSIPTGAFGSETNGSTLATSVFSAGAASALEFYFHYVTSDGGTYSDYAWVELFSSSDTPVALLATARTQSSGSAIPGLGLPAPQATLAPSKAATFGGEPEWSALGGSSGACYSTGCGHTGWVHANYVIATPGDYYLKVGVVNWKDAAYDSGLAVDGIAIDGTPIGTGGPPSPCD